MVRGWSWVAELSTPSFMRVSVSHFGPAAKSGMRLCQHNRCPLWNRFPFFYLPLFLNIEPCLAHIRKELHRWSLNPRFSTKHHKERRRSSALFALHKSHRSSFHKASSSKKSKWPPRRRLLRPAHTQRLPRPLGLLPSSSPWWLLCFGILLDANCFALFEDAAVSPIFSLGSTQHNYLYEIIPRVFFLTSC